MALFEATVKLVNRVRDKNGKPVPYTAYYGGDTVVIVDELRVPLGPARVIIHHSMYKQEPDTLYSSYRLGCPDLGLPCDPLTEEEVNRLELVDRDLLGPDRQFGAKDRFGRALKPVKKVYHAMRNDPLTIPDPGSGDGAFAGTYGEPKKPE